MQFAIPCCIWLSSAFIPGKENVHTDFSFMRFSETTEWSLHSNITECFFLTFGYSDIIIFTSSLLLMSGSVILQQDPQAYDIDAFILSLNEYNLLTLFLPSSLILTASWKLLL